MAERYTRLFSLPENLYTSGAPVMIAAGALLKDNQTGKTLAQLKFKSLSEKNIKALKVTIAASDVSGNALTGVDEYQYLDLAVERNETFGQKQAIYLPDAVTRSFAAKCTEVVFKDGTVWKAAEDAIWNTLPEQETIDDCLKELAAQYRRDTSRLSKYALLEHEDLWLCTCGAFNHNEETACHRCNYEKAELLKAMDLEGLRERKAEYDKKAAEEAELRAKEAAKRAEKKAAEDKARRAKMKKIGIIAVVPLVIVIAYVLITSVFIPNSHYNDAIALMEAGQYTEAIAAFEAMGDYKDSTEKIDECNAALLDLKYNEAYNEAVALMEAGQYTEAIAAFEAMGDYKDSTVKIDECNTAILDGKYNEAVTLMEKGQYTEAIAAFEAMGDYKDALARAKDLILTEIKNARVGDYITFGAYEQDNNISNGQEDVEWLVLEVKDGKALVISKYALDCKPYNTSFTDVTWETCTLRKWLNNDFINATFSTDEKAMIPTVTVSADKNPEYPTNPGNATQDQVFLLSIGEVDKYFSSDDARKCWPTDYAVANKVYVHSDGNCWWWLRSPGDRQSSAAGVYYAGYLMEYGFSVGYSNYAVRPAMWIDLNA